MSRRIPASCATVAALVAVGSLATIPVAGQDRTAAAKTASTTTKSWKLPRTAWGDTDLQGVWSNATRTPFERPTELGAREALTDAEVADLKKQAESRVDRPPRAGDPGTYNRFWWEDGDFSNRTSLVVDPPDGRLPPRTPEGQVIARWQRGTDSWEDRTLWERCLTRGLPNTMFPGFYNNNYQILQGPGYVVIIAEMIHDARIIPLDRRPHLQDNLRQSMGDSRGHWEGNTLVVDVTNFTDKTTGRLNPAGSYGGSGDALHLVERFTRTEDTIDYVVTVDDPKQFTRPWTAAIPMKKEDTYQIFEYACHEGNLGMEGILTGARDEERAAAEAAKKK